MPAVNIPEDTYARLAEWAARLGEDPELFILRMLDKMAPPPPPPRTPAEREAARERISEFFRARADQYPPGFTVDCDRESIYREREDAQL